MIRRTWRCLGGKVTFSDDAALAELVRLMERPFDHIGLDPLHVDLVVDAAVAGNWYEAK